MIGRALEFDRADEAPAGPGGKPALDEAIEPARVADDVAEEPVDRAELARIRGECARPAMFDAGQRGDLRIERRLVDADDARSEALQDPAPAAGRAAEIDAERARKRPLADEGQRLPQLQIGAARRRRAVLDELGAAVRKGA